MPLYRRGNPRGLKINRGHPAAKGCMMLAVPGMLGGNAAKAYDLISRQKSTNTGTAVSGRDPYLGNYVGNAGNANDLTFTNRPTTNPSVFTFALLIKTDSTLVAATVFTNSPANPLTGLTLGISSGGAFNFFMEAAGGTFLTSSVALAVSTIYFVCGGWNGVNSFLIVRKVQAGGNTVIDTGTTPPSAATAASTWALGASAGSALFHFALAYFSFNGLSIGEALKWSRDPWAIFQRANEIPLFGAGAGGGGGGSNVGQFLLLLNVGN